MTMTRPFAVLCATACCIAPAIAATPWTMPAGSTDTTTYSGGQTDHQLFTPDSPNVGDDAFLFTPSNFTATDNQTTSDTASFLSTAKAGRTLTSVSADLTGDFSTLGGNAFQFAASPGGLRPIFVFGPTASATGMLTLTNPFTHAVLTKAFDFNGQFDSDGGPFTDHVTIALPAGWKSAQVSLSAELTATAFPGSTSTIQLKSASVGVQTHAAAVPLPPGALAAIPGIALAYVARRRMRTA